MLSMKDKEKVPQWVKIISEEALLLFMHLCFHEILMSMHKYLLIKKRKKNRVKILVKILVHQNNISPQEIVTFHVHIVLRIIE